MRTSNFKYIFIILISSLLLINCGDKQSVTYTGTFEHVFVSPNTVEFFYYTETSDTLFKKTIYTARYMFIKNTDDNKNHYKFVTKYGFFDSTDTLYIYLNDFDIVDGGSYNKGKSGFEQTFKIK